MRRKWGNWGEPGSNRGPIIICNAVGVVVLALALSALLGRTLTHPLRKLTMATEVVARGQLGQQVAVRSRDELGTLAASFNHMNADLASASSLRRQDGTAEHRPRPAHAAQRHPGLHGALRDGKLPPEPDIIDTLHTEAQHLQHLIDDLRTLSLTDAGELPLTRQTVSPRVLLERAAAHLAQAQAQAITIALDAPPDLPNVDVDPERLAQVLGNLLSNAVRYTRCSGITLSAQTTGNEVRLHVRDTGTGIPPEALPHIFERFFHVDPSRQQDGSSGLGPAIAKGIVEAHGGRIGVESTPGRGTTFTIGLPTSAGVRSQHNPPAHRPQRNDPPS